LKQLGERDEQGQGPQDGITTCRSEENDFRCRRHMKTGRESVVRK